MNKKCSKCQENKELDLFNKDNQTKDGFHPYCRECSNIISKKSYSNNKEKVLERQKKYRENNQEKIAQTGVDYRISNKENIRVKGQLYYLKNREKLLIQQKEYGLNNKEKIIIKNTQYRKNCSKKIAKYMRDRRNQDIQFKLTCNLRTRLYNAIKGENKAGSAVRDLGCSVSKFKVYIESKFQPGMTWDNWSMAGWHIDHIIPLSKLDLTNTEELKKACHYTNLQPLWAIDNLRKSNKIEELNHG